MSLNKLTRRQSKWIRKTGVVLMMSGLLMTIAMQEVSASQDSDNEDTVIVHFLSKELPAEENLITMQISNLQLSTALEKLAETAGVGISYNPDILPEMKVDLNMRDVPVHVVLYELLEGTNLEPVLPFSGDVIEIRNKKDTMIDVDAFQETVSGQVTDAQTGEALPGVNIVIEGTTTGTTTEFDGTFEVSVVDLQRTLRISYIGYQTQEIAIAGRTEIGIQLEPAVAGLDDVVVTAFGIEREVKSLTYSTQNVSIETLTSAREPNVITSLTGRIAGLNITNTSGGPGTPSRVNLRGNRSFTGSSNPLYVLDGVPIRGNPQDLSPDDIESINVLKGGNAAALYGSAAQNGVIIINTNRARAGQVNISISSTFMVNEPNILFDFQNEYGQGSGGVYQRGSEFSFGPRMEGQQVPFWSPDPNHELAGTTVALTPQPNNVRDVFQTGYNMANNITANLGGERTQTAFSYTYTDAEGIIPGNTLQRNNLSVRVNSELTRGLNLDSRVAYSRGVRENPPDGTGTATEYANPIRGAYRMPRSIQTVHYRDFEYEDANGNLRQNFFNPGSNGGFNPYWAINRNQIDITDERVIAMTSLTYDFSEALSLMVRGAYDGSNSQRDHRWHNDTYIIGDNGRYQVTKSDGRTLNVEFLMSFTQSLTEDWNFNANVGGNILQSRNYSLSSNTGSQGLTVPNLFSLGNTQSIVVSENIGSPRDVHSLYAFGQIGWRDTIFLDVTGRNDWSSTLPAESRSYFYPSFGLSAVISDLIPAFPDFFTFARVRASYAQVGSSAPSFALSRSANVVPGGASGFLRIDGSIPAENLKPEQTTSIELGTDLRFADGRLGLDLTFYETTTVDQLFSVALPIGSGAASFFTNGGDIQNKGFEASLNATPVQTSQFNWDMTLNWNRNRNVVVKISDELQELQIGSDFLREVFLKEGRPYGETTSRGYARDDQGRVIVENNGIPRFTPARSDVVVANFQPDWMGSIYNQITFGNISAGFLIDHRQGGTIVSMSNALMYADGVTSQTLQGRDGGLVFGDNFMAHEEAVMVDAEGNPTNNVNTNSTDAESFWRSVGGRNAPVGEVFVEEATNTRLRELTIGYNFGEAQLSSIGLPFSNINFSLVGRNLFFIYRASDNIDPDLMAGTNRNVEGWELLAPPTTRSFGANIKVDF